MQKALRLFLALIDRLSDLGLVLATICVALMTLLVSVEVIGRSFFKYSTLVADEMSGYLQVGVLYFGVAYTLKQGGFIRVEVLYNRLSPRGRAVADLVGLLFCAALALLLLQHLWKLAGDSRRLGATSIGVSRTPLHIPQTVPVVGAALLLLQLVAEIVRAAVAVVRPDLAPSLAGDARQTGGTHL